MANYYVIVNKDNEIYEAIDPIYGTFSRLKFTAKKKAVSELNSLLDEGMLDEAKEWTVENYATWKERLAASRVSDGNSKLTDLAEVTEDMFGFTDDYLIPTPESKKLKEIFKECIAKTGPWYA